MSQSAVSAQIRQLETTLGHDLFIREGRNLVLTETGARGFGYAEGIFNLGAEMLESARDGHDARELRIGAIATLSRNFQQNLLSPLIVERSVRLVLESASLDELLRRLQVHKLDLVLSNRAVAASGTLPLRCQRIARQSVCIVGPPCADDFIFPDHLEGTSVLLPGSSSDIRRQFDLLMQQLGVTPVIMAEVDDMAMLRLLARASDGVAIVPEVVVQDELHAGTLHKYCELPDLFESFYAITARRQFQQPALQAIIVEHAAAVSDTD